MQPAEKQRVSRQSNAQSQSQESNNLIHTFLEGVISVAIVWDKDGVKVGMKI